MLRLLSDRIIRVSKTVGWVCGFVSAISTVCLILLTVSDVFMRFFLSKPINGSFELTEYLMILIVFMAIPWATTRNAHVRVDLITGRFSRRTKATLYAISCLLSMGITWLFAWYTLPEVLYARDIMFKSDMLDIPMYPFYFIIMVGFYILFFTLIAALIEFIDEAMTK